METFGKGVLIALIAIVIIVAVGFTLGCTGDTATTRTSDGYFEDGVIEAQDYYLTKRVSPDPGSIRVIDLHIEAYGRYDDVTNILFGYNKSGEPHTSRILYRMGHVYYMDIDGVV